MTNKMMIGEELNNIKNRVPELEKLNGKTLLITGGSGFLGSWFNAIFHDYSVEVTSVDNHLACDGTNKVRTTDKVRFVKADINEFNLNKKYDYIIHAAGVASPVYYRKYPIETIKGMGLGLIRLLDHAVEHKPEAMLYFSSSEMYGNPHTKYVPIPEHYNGNVSCTGPRACYDETKRFGETCSVVYAKEKKVPVKVVRPFNVYGPGMRIKDDRVVPKFLFQAIEGEDLTVHLPGKQTRTFCYIEDAMVGFLKVLLNGVDGEAYNIGHREPEITMNELAHKISDMFEPKTRIKTIEMPQEYPSDQAQRRCPDLRKAESIGYDPQIGLLDGLKRSKEWCEYLWQRQI